MTDVENQITDPNKEIDDKQEQIRKLYHKKKEQVEKQADLIFKVLSTIVILGSTICFLNIFTFRQYSQSRGIYVISPLTFIWAVVGYFFAHYSRKWFNQFVEKRAQPYMHPRNVYYPLKNQQKKIKTITKQLYDLIFHTATTIVILVLFRQESWFPMCSGGWGSCDSIFATYPNWPQALNPAIYIFYLFQLGVNIHILLELLIFKRKESKSMSYFQLVFHHCITVILILFSIGYNFVPIGIMVMFVHDSSDAARAMGRVMSESKYSVSHLTLSKVVDFVYLSTWAYMRSLILPFCLIVSMYNNIPDETKDFNFVSLQHIYLMSLCCGIYFLHSYWVYFLYKGSEDERKGNAAFKKWLQEEKLKTQSQREKEIKKE